MGRRTQYCQVVSSSQLDVQIEHKPNKNSSNLFCRDQQNDSKVYIERQKPGMDNFEGNHVGEMMLPDIKTYYKSTVKDNVVLAK